MRVTFYLNPDQDKPLIVIYGHDETITEEKVKEQFSAQKYHQPEITKEHNNFLDEKGVSQNRIVIFANKRENQQIDYHDATIKEILGVLASVANEPEDSFLSFLDEDAKKRLKDFISLVEKIPSEAETVEMPLETYIEAKFGQEGDRLTPLIEGLAEFLGFPSTLNNNNNNVKERPQASVFVEEKLEENLLPNSTTSVNNLQRGLLLIKISSAYDHYLAFHNSNDTIYNRGYKPGFFTRLRHGKKGLTRARNLLRSANQAKTSEDLFAILNDFFNSNPPFHNHSFSAYLLDNLRVYAGMQDVKPEKYTNAYWNILREQVIAQPERNNDFDYAPVPGQKK